MATSVKFSQKLAPNYHCKIPLIGQVAPHSKAKLVVETVKYLMFQRQQIPLPFEQLKYDQQRHKEQLTGTEQENVSRIRKPQTLEQKRWAVLIQAMDELISNIENLFCLCQVTHILVIFGATVISPKEVHHIVFSEGKSSSEEKLSTKHCQRQFMKAMITNNSLIDAKSLPLTSMHFMVYAHRESGLSWFKPRATFRMPTRGQNYTFEVQCGSDLNSKDIEEGHSLGSEAENSVSDVSSVEDDASCSSASSATCGEDTHMWFGAPLVIKGVKDRTSKKASADDIWM